MVYTNHLFLIRGMVYYCYTHIISFSVPTLAAFISEARGAVHQLLLRQGHQLPRGQCPGTFQGTGAAECPTRATLLPWYFWGIPRYRLDIIAIKNHHFSMDKSTINGRFL